MAFDYIQEADLYTTFEDAKKFSLPFFLPFDEFERIARNQPHPGIDKNLPKVTDGTLAAIIQELPKRIIQQVPSGSIIANDRWLEIVAEYILQHEIIPNSNQVAALIQKCWALVSKSLTYGSQPAYVQFINRGDYFGTDFTLPYVRDVLLEPGKLSDRDSNVIFLRSWWTKNQIEAIIKKEDMLVKNSQERKDAEAYVSGWDLGVLADLKDKSAQKDAMQMTPAEKSKLTNAGFIEIVHCFQRGIGGQFFSFSPKLKEVVRRKVNPDPRGYIPIHFMYANVDLSNPYGRGSVEISGGMQNLLDSEVQSYQYMRALLMNPPLEVRGEVSSTTLKYQPNAIWRMGANPNNSVTPAKLETASLQQFPQNYGLIKSQIMALNSAQDNTISATAGNTHSKTPQGVKDNQMQLGVSDNYMRRQFESVFEEIINTEINLYFAERHGTQELTLDITTADKLKELEEKDPITGEVKQQLVGPNNVIRIDYDTETPKLEFKADPTSSTIADNQEQITDLQELLTATTASPYIPYLMQAEGKELHLGEVYVQLFERYGIKDIDKIITDIPMVTDPKTGQKVPGKTPTVMTPFFDKPHVSATFKDLPPAAQVQLLANGGINIQESDVLQPNIEQIAGGRLQNPVQPAYIDPQTGQITSGHPPTPGIGYVDPSTGQPVQGQQSEHPEHPIIQLMTTLGIKFTDLPLDSQHMVLDELGIPTQTNSTPSNDKLQIEASNAAVNVAKLQHEEQLQQDAHNVAASNAAVNVASLHHTVVSEAAKRDLAQQQADQSAAQAEASQKLQEKQLKQPKVGTNG